MKTVFVLFFITFFHQISTECLSNDVIEALGWKALDTPVEVTNPVICSEFYKTTNAKSCIDLESLKSLVKDQTEDFAENFSENQVQVLTGLDADLELFAEDNKKINENKAEYSDEVQSAFSEAKNYVGKYSSDFENMRKLINDCNISQQINSFGIFCLLSSDMASTKLNSQSVLENGLAALSVLISPLSAIEMANKCAATIKNTCLFLEMRKAISLYDDKTFDSEFALKCLPGYLDCINEGESGSGCADDLKKKMFENFSSPISGEFFDDKTKEVLKGIKDNAGELYDKLKTHGFGPIKEGAENTIQTVKGYIDNFSIDDIKDTIADAGDAITDSLTNAGENISDSITDTFSNPFRILEANMQMTYTVDDDGFDSYENGKDSGFENVESLERFYVSIITVFIFGILFVKEH